MALLSFLPWILALSVTVSVLGFSCSARAQAVNDFPGAVMLAVDRGQTWDYRVALVIGLVRDGGPAVAILPQEVLDGPTMAIEQRK
jgi:hypothetical protein